MIIVNWNGAADLPACLAALAQQTHAPLEIIIIDNASTDASAQVLAAAQQTFGKTELRLIRNTVNVGFCQGNNQGIALAQGEFILLLNADVTLAPPFIAQLVKLMQADQAVGIAVGKLLSGAAPGKIDSTGIVIRKNRRAFDRGQGETDSGQYQQVEEVFGASGAACLYRRAMLADIEFYGEYLDALFFAYKEDVDLSWRARLAGWKCVYTPAAVGWHGRKWGAGKRQNIPRAVRRHSLKNRYLLLLKNERRETLWPHLPAIVWHELRSLAYILIREPYLLAAFGDIFRAWPEIMAKRRLTQQFASQRGTAQKIRAWFQ